MGVLLERLQNASDWLFSFDTIIHWRYVHQPLCNGTMTGDTELQPNIMNNWTFCARNIQDRLEYMGSECIATWSGVSFKEQPYLVQGNQHLHDKNRERRWEGGGQKEKEKKLTWRNQWSLALTGRCLSNNGHFISLIVHTTIIICNVNLEESWRCVCVCVRG